MWWATHVAPRIKSKMADADAKALKTMRFRLRHGVGYPFFFMPALTLAASLGIRCVPAQVTMLFQTFLVHTHARARAHTQTHATRVVCRRCSTDSQMHNSGVGGCLHNTSNMR